MKKVPVRVILWGSGHNFEYVNVEVEPATTYHRFIWNICQELNVKKSDILHWKRVFPDNTTSENNK